MTAYPAFIRFTFFQIIYPFCNAEVMPVGPVRRLSAGYRYFFKGRDQRFGAVEKGVNVGVGLAFEISHKISENKAKIDQKDHDSDNAED